MRSDFKNGDLIKSRVLTAIRKDGGMRYRAAWVIGSDIQSWSGEDIEMLEVEDEFGEVHEVWADSVFHHERIGCGK